MFHIMLLYLQLQSYNIMTNNAMIILITLALFSKYYYFNIMTLFLKLYDFL